MKRAAGFTLIELVIVIVILGILGAVAAPRFFNLQGDAYAANMNALRASISSAATIANAKAQLAGKGLTQTETDDVPGYDKIGFKFGFPVADATVDSDTVQNKGILKTLDSFDYDRYILDVASGASALTITPKSIDNEKCMLTYTEATDSKTPATVTVDVSGC